MQNLCLSAIEAMYRANEVYLQGTRLLEKQEQRLSFQHQALTELKLLSYMAQLAMEGGCILPKQYEQITKKVFDCQNLLGAWINSDKRRFSQ
jgi:hypothetical protein